MRAIDTSVLVRLMTRDDDRQVPLAEQALAEKDLISLPTVLLETEWVLRAIYHLPRDRITEALQTVCNQDNIIVVSPFAVAAALATYADEGDFGDLLHAALAAEFGATEIVTFDKGFLSPAGTAAPSLLGR